MDHEFRGQCIYTAESDTHFPELTVWETVQLAVTARCPKGSMAGMNRSEHLHHVTSAILRMFNLTSAKNTKIGNDLVRGVSGGERRRVTIAEAFASFSPLQFWDNTTRGMDSATALQCVKTFQQFTLLSGATTTLSLYQASQSILNCFDKVTVLYEGQQIFFGTWSDALEYFQSLGFQRPQRFTTGDFLTALTNPVEAQSMIMPGWSLTIPKSAVDFAEVWRNSKQRRRLSDTIDQVRTGWRADNSEGLSSFRRVIDTERSNSL
jgi:ATP-binding cassette subfamily G (WHITE) protein 2 (PDR)